MKSEKDTSFLFSLIIAFFTCLQIIALLFPAFLEYGGMKILTYILTLSLLSSCVLHSEVDDGVVQVIGVRGGNEVVRGMWVCIDASTILTSAHVVRDDTINYQLRNARYQSIHVNSTIMERDNNSDIAYLRAQEDVCKRPKKYTWKTNDTGLWHAISIPVMRSGSMIMLTGTIISLTGTVLAYDTLGRTGLMTWVLMTDILTQPWDSGAPILDNEGRVVDVVHIQ